MKKIWIGGAGLIGVLVLAVGCDAERHAENVSVVPKPPPGANIVLRSPVKVAQGLEVIIADVVIPPNTTVPPHYHPGEEFLYILEGSAIHVEEGKPDQVISAGEAYVIPLNTPHAPRGGPEGGRAIVFRLHVAGQPERIPVDAVNSPGAEK